MKTSGESALPQPLNDWLADVKADPLIFDADINQEARGNLWSFSLSIAIARTLAVADVARFLHAIIDARRVQLVESSPDRPMVYYCWFDEQSGTLRFSLVSGNRTRTLPFGCKIELVDDLQVICKQFLESPYLDGIPFDTLQVFPAEELLIRQADGTWDDAPSAEYTLLVFAIELS